MTRVRDILQKKDARVVFIGPSLTLRQALETIVENKVGALPVKDERGDIVGIITERDLMRAVYERQDLDAHLVQEHMTASIVAARKDDGIDSVMEQMTENRFRHVPILENHKLVGIISVSYTHLTLPTTPYV